MGELSSQVSGKADPSPQNLNWTPSADQPDPPSGMVLTFAQKDEPAAKPAAVGATPPPPPGETVLIDLDNLSVNLPVQADISSNVQTGSPAADQLDNSIVAEMTGTMPPALGAEADVAAAANVTPAKTTPASASAFIHLLPEFRMVFAGGMICEIENDNFKPVCWDEAFKPATPEAQKVWNLNPASAFRIAYRTGMPYLGPVVATDVNAKFFSAWGFATPPQIVLIRPIKDGMRVTHFLICISDVVQKNHILLSEGDRIARLLTDSLGLAQAA